MRETPERRKQRLAALAVEDDLNPPSSTLQSPEREAHTEEVVREAAARLVETMEGQEVCFCCFERLEMDVPQGGHVEEECSYLHLREALSSPSLEERERRWSIAVCDCGKLAKVGVDDVICDCRAWQDGDAEIRVVEVVEVISSTPHSQGAEK